MEVDIENFGALRHYLTAHGHLQPSDNASFEKLAGGISNRTVKVTWPDGKAWVLKQALAKLRVRVDWFSDPQRIAVEAKALRWLNSAAPPGMTPTFIFEDLGNHLMAMEAIPGDHENWKSILLSGRIVPDHFKQFGLLLGTVHRRSSESRAEVSETFAETSYFESLRLEPYYLYTAKQVPVTAEFLKGLAKDTLHHKDCLVHGDFSPKNTILYRGKLILLDYEVFHFGEPAFDIGFAMAHFLSKAHHFPGSRTSFANAAALFVKVYRDEIASLEWAASLEPRLVRHTLGCSLARVAGKSQLEYRTVEESVRQQELLLQLIADPPATLEDLIAQFISKIDAYAEN
jgi:5-methylthioribose kinase